MENFKELYSDYRDYILCFILFIIFLGCLAFIFWYFSNDMNTLKKQMKDRPVVEVKKENDSKNRYIVDIKGEVKRPGVYELDKGKRVIDVVKKAGGFTVYADSSANNLSMKISDEMVIIIYSQKEIRNYLTTKKKEKLVLEKCKSSIISNNSCVESSNGSDRVSSDNDSSTSTKNDKDSSSKTSKSSGSSSSSKTSSDDDNKLISLNTATKEELMTLSGIGESKADAIIEYRSKKNFETIEEIKEVSGIGDALFEKIKDSITT